MGTGKTVVGEALARWLNLHFIEVDALIEQKSGKTIAQIFHQDGEIAFREMEIAVIKEVAGSQRSVIACGGGAILNHINTDRLRHNGIIVYLTATPEIIMQRVIGHEQKRPLLQTAKPELTIGELLRTRKALYEDAADITIDTSQLDIAAVVEQIVGRLKYEGFCI